MRAFSIFWWKKKKKEKIGIEIGIGHLNRKTQTSHSWHKTRNSVSHLHSLTQSALSVQATQVSAKRDCFSSLKCRVFTLLPAAVFPVSDRRTEKMKVELRLYYLTALTEFYNNNCCNKCTIIIFFFLMRDIVNFYDY